MLRQILSGIRQEWMDGQMSGKIVAVCTGYWKYRDEKGKLLTRNLSLVLRKNSGKIYGVTGAKKKKHLTA